jgi:hypothetical protein
MSVEPWFLAMVALTQIWLMSHLDLMIAMRTALAMMTSLAKKTTALATVARVPLSKMVC